MLTKKDVFDVRDMLKDGKTITEVAAYYDVSRQWVSRFKKVYLPELDKRSEFGASKRKMNRVATQVSANLKRFNRESFRYTDELMKAQSSFFTRKRQNSKQKKWEFSIQMSDLEWPTHCPILGVELDWFAEYRKENSPSIDRINPKEGYIPGNVQIISWRANRIKNDGTAEEHQKIADYMFNQQ
jgi:hypothetical protein